MNVPWRRGCYQAALAIPLAAVLLDAYLGNLLWLVYGLVGVALVGTLILLDHAYGWRLPSRLVWAAGLPLGMHYLGGSLSGLHQVGGPNGLYYAFPWWDNVVHFLGCGAAGVVAAHLLAGAALPRLARTVLAASVAATAGLVVELYEFAGFAWFGTIDQGYYTNTVFDLYYNLLGAGAGAWAWTRAAGDPPRPALLADARPPPA